jgi:hypothetical protein
MDHQQCKPLYIVQGDTVVVEGTSYWKTAEGVE